MHQIGPDAVGQNDRRETTALTLSSPKKCSKPDRYASIREESLRIGVLALKRGVSLSRCIRRMLSYRGRSGPGERQQ